MALETGNSLHSDPAGEPGGGGFIYRGLCDTVIFGLHFLYPKDVRSLSLEAI